MRENVFYEKDTYEEVFYFVNDGLVRFVGDERAGTSGDHLADTENRR